MKLKNLAPYIINAHIYWLEDSGAEPQIYLNNSEKTMFPPSFAKEKSVLFNITDSAISKFSLDEVGISFTARFSGREFTVYAPLDCIVAIRSKDGSVHLPINKESPPAQQTEPVATPVDDSVLVKESREKVRLSLIQGDNQGNGVPSGKLSLV